MVTAVAPDDGQGCLAATAVMIGGIAVLGTTTATPTSWLVEQVADVEQQEVEDLRGDRRSLSLKVDQLLGRSDGGPNTR